MADETRVPVEEDVSVLVAKERDAMSSKCCELKGSLVLGLKSWYLGGLVSVQVFLSLSFKTSESVWQESSARDRNEAVGLWSDLSWMDTVEAARVLPSMLTASNPSIPNDNPS